MDISEQQIAEWAALVDSIHGFAHQHYDGGLFERNSLAELDEHGKWRTWDMNAPFSTAACAFIAAAPAIIRALLQARQREPMSDAALDELRTLVEQAQNNETRGRGCCEYCGHEDYPVDENGAEIEGEDVSSAAQWWIDHADWCPSVIMPKLLERTAALEAALTAAQAKLDKHENPM
jgi:hypothetical protein